MYIQYSLNKCCGSGLEITGPESLPLKKIRKRDFTIKSSNFSNIVGKFDPAIKKNENRSGLDQSEINISNTGLNYLSILMGPQTIITF